MAGEDGRYSIGIAVAKSNTFDDSITEQSSDDWLRDYNGTGQNDGNRAQESFGDPPQKDLEGKFRYIDHRTAQITVRDETGKEKPSWTVILLEFMHVESGQIASAWFNCPLGKHTARQHGKFARPSPRSYFFQFVVATIGEPAQWCRAYGYLRRLKKLSFIGKAKKKKRGWVVTRVALESAPHIALVDVGSRAAGGRGAGSRTTCFKTAGGKTTGTQCVDNAMSSIEKTQTASANSECTNEVQKISAISGCRNEVQEKAPKNPVSKKGENTTESSSAQLDTFTDDEIEVEI